MELAPDQLRRSTLWLLSEAVVSADLTNEKLGDQKSTAVEQLPQSHVQLRPPSKVVELAPDQLRRTALQLLSKAVVSADLTNE